MCRNVLIYFGRDEVVSFVERVADWLPPGGWLFLGYSESLWQLTDRFQLVRVGDAFVYRRCDALASARAPKERTVRPKATDGRVALAGLRPETRTPRRARVSPIDARPLEGVAPAQTVEPQAAIVAFRKLVYLDPDQPVAHLHLGLALEAASDIHAARRAFAASRAALDRCDAAVLESVLEGYSVTELSALLDRKMEPPS
jgi:chemotaxis protein methyltransferase CheR